MNLKHVLLTAVLMMLAMVKWVMDEVGVGVFVVWARVVVLWVVFHGPLLNERLLNRLIIRLATRKKKQEAMGERKFKSSDAIR